MHENSALRRLDQVVQDTFRRRHQCFDSVEIGKVTDLAKDGTNLAGKRLLVKGNDTRIKNIN